MTFCFKNTSEDDCLTEEVEQHYRNYKNLRFCEKHNESDKVRDRCHLTSKYTGPAHQNCNLNVTQKQSNFIPFVFHSCSSCD